MPLSHPGPAPFRPIVIPRLRPLVLVAGLALGAIAPVSCARESPGGGPETTSPTSSSQPVVPPAEAVVRLRMEPCTGELELTAVGVAVDDGIIATVAHAFDGARQVMVTVDGRGVPATIVWLDPDRDLALLDLDGEGGSDPTDRPWLPLGESADGDEVEVLIPPPASEDETGGDGVEAKPGVVLQQVQATLDGDGERAAIEIRADIERGDSGAPVVNDQGQVIGVVFATARGDERGWVIAASEIRAALDAQPGRMPSGDPVPLSCP